MGKYLTISIVGYVLVFAFFPDAHAAQCVSWSGSDTVPAGAMADCVDFVLLSVSDFNALPAAGDVPTLQAIFSMPVAEDMGALWLAGFSLPLILYLTAFGFAKVINFIK